MENDTTSESPCAARELPTAQKLFQGQPTEAAIAMAVGCGCALFTLVVFAEELYFLFTHFNRKRRRMTKTMWVLALYPVFAVTSLIGAIVPRASCLVELVANVYFASVMYDFVRLMVDYMGGERRMWSCMADTSIKLQSPPCCCCCCCLPTVKFTKSTYLKIQMLVLQVALIRPILFFIAAVLWSNGDYIPGMIAYDNAYIYVSVINLVSTMFAVYGLILTQKAFSPFLPEFQLMGKFLSIQVTLIVTIIVNLIINILLANQAIPCVPLLNSAARGDRVSHWAIVVLMAPLCLVGRKFFRRKEEAYKIADQAKGPSDFKPDDANGNEGLMYTKETPNV